MKKVEVLIGFVLTVFVGFTLLASLSMSAETIKVGIVLPLTGPQAKFGEIEKISFYMALEEINAAGGINGRMSESTTTAIGGGLRISTWKVRW